MKNYLKFVFAVAGLTLASFAPIAANAKKLPAGGCSNTLDTCGYTSGGNHIDGKYS
ncbi:hypothetical protein [Flavobacterium sp.]|uniref:hypothetical protein n=1 Tax=Flavobacterium sp. TaxID=239 RepID=UPI003751DD6D